MSPYLLGAIAGKENKKSFNKGFEIGTRIFGGGKTRSLRISQGDGAGGDCRTFSRRNLCAAISPIGPRGRTSRSFRALPVLGKDGTLAKIQKENPGAGHVFAKTGTYDSKIN